MGSPGCTWGRARSNSERQDRLQTRLRNGEPRICRSDFARDYLPCRVALQKQFTSFAINLLALEGRLSLDDEIHDHFPEFGDFGKAIIARCAISAIIPAVCATSGTCCNWRDGEWRMSSLSRTSSTSPGNSGN